MIAFDVQDMTCGHCVNTVTKAVQAADRDARVRIDLPTHRVEIEPATASAERLEEAIRAAGYTPKPA
jgi:copper chaperone